MAIEPAAAAAAGGAALPSAAGAATTGAPPPPPLAPGGRVRFTSVSVAPSAELVNLLPVSMQFLLDDRRRREGLLSSLVRRVAERETLTVGVADLAAVPFVTAPRLTRAAVAAATHRLAPPRGGSAAAVSSRGQSVHSGGFFSRLGRGSIGSSRGEAGRAPLIKPLGIGFASGGRRSISGGDAPPTTATVPSSRHARSTGTGTAASAAAAAAAGVSRTTRPRPHLQQLVTLAPGEVVPLLTVAPRRPYWVAVREPSGAWTAPLRFRRVDVVADLPLVAPVRPLELLPAAVAADRTAGRGSAAASEGGGGGEWGDPPPGVSAADAEHLRLHVPAGADTAGGPSGLLSQAIRRLPSLGCVLLRAAITPVGSVRLSVDAPYRLSNQVRNIILRVAEPPANALHRAVATLPVVGGGLSSPPQQAPSAAYSSAGAS